MHQATAPVFTDRALVSRQAILQGYTRLLVNRFKDSTSSALALRESFSCLQDTKHNPWIELLSNSLGESILWRLIPAKLRKMQSDHYATTLDKIQRRMSSQVM
ncbi:hypothetical protein RRF57_013290 [Xylaria bambusicola]|uniref:Uncharacterized protein n=1 Tax=Xylaria bambusicola TaxID=326684 RepID=A0AAN7URG6_9PEZI